MTSSTFPVLLGLLCPDSRAEGEPFRLPTPAEWEMGLEEWAEAPAGEPGEREVALAGDSGPGPAILGVPEVDRGRIRGRVEAFGTAREVRGARVEARTLQDEVLWRSITDATGWFEVTAPRGEFQVVVQHDAFEAYDAREELRAGDVLEVVYRLRPAASSEQIIVWGEREREEVSRQVYAAEEIKKIPGSFGDPVRALQSLPGVARPQSLEGNLVVRGAEGINTGFYVDDMPVPFLFHSLIGKSVINPAFIKDVEFYPGGMPSRFGEVTQAAVNVRTGTTPFVGRRGLADVNLLEGSLAQEVGGEDWTVRAAGRYSWMSLLIGTIVGIRWVAMGGDWGEASYFYPAYWDAFVSAEKRLPGDVVWSTSLLASGDSFNFHPGEYDSDGDGEPDPSLQEQYDLPFDPNRWIDAGFVRARVRREVRSGPHRSDTWLASGPEHQASLLGDLFGSGEGPYYGRVDGWATILRREDRWVRSETQEVVAGGQASVTPVTAQDYTEAFADPDHIPTTTDTQVSAGLFGEWQWRPGPWLVSPGLRGWFYWFNGNPWWEPEPRLTVRRTLDKGWVAKGFVGRFTQMPPIERYAQGIGNPDLPLMYTWQSALGGEWTGGPWQVDASVYGSWMDHLVVRDLEFDVVTMFSDTATETAVPVYNEVTGYAYGVEALLRLNPTGRWWGWAAGTLSRSIRVDPETGDTFPGDYDQPVALTLLAAFDAPRAWTLSGRFRVTSGHPYTPLYGVYNPGTDMYESWAGETNAERFPWFHQLDVRAEKTWKKRRADWSFYLDIYNVYWAKNPFVATYNYDYSELISVIYIPLIPTLGVEAKY